MSLFSRRRTEPAEAAAAARPKASRKGRRAAKAEAKAKGKAFAKVARPKWAVQGQIQ